LSGSIIKVEGLGKKFTISRQGRESYTALRDVIRDKVREVAGRSKTKIAQEEFWAIRDLNFEIGEGEAVGIIGRNGAGKSTLLKILSRITEPSTGRVELNGRTASLLEVGTGFHPELTGRENIFLNGAILGMSRAEIKNKFEEIVDFSGVEKFLDTPVKRYSSGMYVRLAFAVAAHLEPEILVVDEVLAVGDAEFQKKCLGKMEDVAKKKGRTILFVSHNLTAIQQLCKTSLWLNNGKLEAVGNTTSIIEKYLGEKKPVTAFKSESDKEVFISGFTLVAKNGGEVVPGQACVFEMLITVKAKQSLLHFAVGVNDRFGARIFTLFTKYNGAGLSLSEGVNKVCCAIESLPLKPDRYEVHLYAGNEFEPYDYIDGGVEFEVSPSPFFENFMPDSTHGAVVIRQQWYQ
jgi:lipopolysaccharide transport system ATP-binding protein